MILCIALYFESAYAAISFDSDKNNYYLGDTIKISGQVSVDPESLPIATIVISSPNSPFVGLIPANVKSDGKFQGEILAEGTTWSYEGTYTVSVTYAGESSETTFEFTKTSKKQEVPKPEVSVTPSVSKPAVPTVKSEPESNPSELQTQAPKTHIPGFPELDKSPQYYIDRYENEPAYKEWFDSQFPGKTVNEVVGYKDTHIVGFPSPDKSPQYYIDRYENEPAYKEWFDSQFPSTSIYNVMGFPNPVEIPLWIKDIAEWWSTGEIDDDTFVSGIQFMIENQIILIPDLPESQSNIDTTIPSWVRNNANWWASDKITEDDFVSAIKFLVEKGIIIV